MRTPLSLFAFILCLFSQALATPISHQLIEQAQSSSYGLELLTDLTTNVGPRRAGTEGDKRAVEWAKAKLIGLGFDRLHIQTVEVPGWYRGKSSASVLSPAPQPLVVTALGYSIGTPTGGIKAPIIRVSSLKALKNLSSDVIKGHIVFLDHKMSRARTADVFRHLINGRTKGASIAASKGALALLVRSVGTSSDRFAHTGMVIYDERLPKIPAAAISSPDADQLTRLLTQHGKVSVALELICGPLPPTKSYNLIAEYDGTEKKEEYVLVGAHLDSWDEGTGTLDNGAGIAIVTAATRLLLDLKQRPKRGIRLIYYAAEEVGLIGARTYAAKNDLQQIYLAAESDFGAGPVYQLHTRFQDPESPLKSELLSALAPLKIEPGHNHTNGGPDVSVLVNKGVPALMLQQDGNDYFDYHHTANDTLDKVNPKHLQQNIAAWAAMIWVVANSEVPLTKLEQ